ncbi:hypothetical protein [Actinomadura rudentiformis]|uniref:hypothetical protein n=1 Tax=Actinomadura rudentiformis TaxID=359158 RepID=UPI00178C79B6|nr:hypothetical protein [Actinomadura rudentiformis]
MSAARLSACCAHGHLGRVVAGTVIDGEQPRPVRTRYAAPPVRTVYLRLGEPAGMSVK